MGIFNSIVTGLFGGPKKRSKVEETANTTQDPWAPVMPYLTDYLGKASALYNGGAPQISPYEQAGYDKLMETAGSSPAIDAAIAANNKTLSGAYLDPKSNPYIADIAKRSAGLAGAQAGAAFGGVGRTGSGLAGYYAGQGSADAANQVFYQNYGDERNRMLEASGQAPQLEAGRYLAPQAIISAGQNISSRPFDINAQYGNILSSLAQLGGQGTMQGTTTTKGYTGGLIGKIADSFTNKLFPA